MKDNMRYTKTKPKQDGTFITISKQELKDFMKNQEPIVKKGFDLKLDKTDLVRLIKFKQPVQRKGYNIMLENVVYEDLRKWFKQKWVNIGKKWVVNIQNAEQVEINKDTLNVFQLPKPLQ